MNTHKNTRLTPLGRERIVLLAADGLRPAEIAAYVGVSLTTLLAHFTAEGVAGLFWPLVTPAPAALPDVQLRHRSSRCGARS